MFLADQVDVICGQKFHSTDFDSTLRAEFNDIGNHIFYSTGSGRKSTLNFRPPSKTRTGGATSKFEIWSRGMRV